MASRILLVDDEIEICRSLKRLLRRFDLEVTFTTNPVQALEMVRAEHFDAVISDYRMPEMFGTEFLGQVQQVAPRTMRLMLSACAEIDTLAATYDEAQILRFVRKPWNDAELVRNLLTLLADKGATPGPAGGLSAAAIDGAQNRVW